MTERNILQEIRRVRHEISEHLGHDPKAISDYYAAIQKEQMSRMINLSGETASDLGRHSVPSSHIPSHDESLIKPIQS